MASEASQVIPFPNSRKYPRGCVTQRDECVFFDLPIEVRALAISRQASRLCSESFNAVPNGQLTILDNCLRFGLSVVHAPTMEREQCKDQRSQTTKTFAENSERT
jgi:hypothetical protein